MALNNKIMFVLDVSDRNSEAFESMMLFVKRLIADIPEKSSVGVVLFDNRTQIRHKLVAITDNKVRQNVLDSFNISETVDIDIESGLRDGLKAIYECGQSEGETIVLVVKHKDRYGTYVETMAPELIQNRVKVICIAVGQNADQNLETLAKKTNGRTYFVADNDILSCSAHSMFKCPGSLPGQQVITVCEETVRVRETLTKTVTFESEIGKNVVFQVISKNYQELSCELKSPLSRSTVKFERDNKLKRFLFRTNTVEPGPWAVIIDNNSKREYRATILVMCEAMEEHPIRMNAFLIEPDVYDPSPPIIVAELLKGSDIVVGAEVKARVDCPDGSQRSLTLKCYKDKIYCSHFTDYQGTGRYRVTVTATHVDDEYCVIMDPSNESPVNCEVPRFERQQSAGCFAITDCLLNVSNLKTTNELKQILNELATKWSPDSAQAVSPMSTHSTLSRINRVGVPTPLVRANKSYSTANSLKHSNSLLSIMSRSSTESMCSSPPAPAYLTVLEPNTPSHSMMNSPVSKAKLSPIPSSASSSGSNRITILKPINSENRGPTPIPRRAVTQDLSLAEMEESLYKSLLVVQKSIDSKKITEKERSEMKNSILAIDTYLTSKNKTMKQLKIYQGVLDKMQDQLF